MLQFKTWLIEQSIVAGVTTSAIYGRWKRGAYPGLIREQKNRRVICVTGEASAPATIKTYHKHPELTGLPGKEYHRVFTQLWRAARHQAAPDS
jgi:hypothetical protein